MSFLFLMYPISLLPLIILSWNVAIFVYFLFFILLSFCFCTYGSVFNIFNCIFVLVGSIHNSIDDVVKLIDLLKGSLLHLLQNVHLLYWYSSRWDYPLVRFRQHLLALLIQLIQLSPLSLLLKLSVEFGKLLLMKNSLCPCFYRLIKHFDLCFGFFWLSLHNILLDLNVLSRTRCFLFFLFLSIPTLFSFLYSLPVTILDERWIVFGHFLLTDLLVLQKCKLIGFLILLVWVGTGIPLYLMLLWRIRLSTLVIT